MKKKLNLFSSQLKHFKHVKKLGRFRKKVEDLVDCPLEDLISEEDYILAEGFIFWPADAEPERWGGPFVDTRGENWVGFRLTDESKRPAHIFPAGKSKLLSIPEIHEARKTYARASKYNYPDPAFNRIGKSLDSDYWHCKVGDTICQRGQMTEEEIQEVTSVLTPIEVVETERKIAAYVSAPGEGNPFFVPSVENPIKLRLYGNDDCSWTCTGAIKENGRLSFFADFSYEIMSTLTRPSWYNMEHNRWYFSN
jgi:hypothetical protein